MGSAAAALHRKPAKRERGPVGFAFTPIPNRFFRDHARNLTLCQLLVVGLVQELATDAGTEDVAITAKDLAQYTGQTRRNVAGAISELSKAGVLHARRVGPNLWAYGFDREALVKLKARCSRTLAVAEMPKPSSKPATPIICPKDGKPCPEIGESQDQGLVRLETKFVANKGKSRSRSEVEFIPPPSRRQRILEMVLAHFGTQLATVPDEELVGKIDRALGGATLEHFDYLMVQNAPRVRSWAFLVHLATDCNRAKNIWAAAQAPELAVPRELVNPLVCPGVGTRECGKPKTPETQICDECMERNREMYLARLRSAGAQPG
jgi:hypothetical protein